MRRVQILFALLISSAVLFGQQPPQQPQQDPTQAEPQDQPGQAVARLSVISGDASVRRGDSGDWVAAALNAPLMAGDSISVAPGGTVELQLDYANFIRIGGDSEVRISQLENGRNQIQVSKGLVTWRVLRDSNAQSEISTPAVAVHPMRLSAVRVEVSADGASRIVVRRGDAEVETPRGMERIREGNMMLVRGSADDPEYQVVYASGRDSWDSWNDQRDAYLERAQSNRYVSPDINGAEELDAYGRWGYDPAYGNVWTPNVPDTWAPYRNGQWVWEDYYGWTWVDYSPWGWAPFHYGSWYFRTGYGWSWFPGPRYGHYWWRPAMVGFFGFGGGGVGFGFGNVGWIPLAPFEVFHPWYGRGWYGGGGFGGRRFGVVNNVNVNVVNVYRNARFGNGVTAVSAQDFQRGSFRNQIGVDRRQLQDASLVRGAVPVSPTASNLRFGEHGATTASIPRGGTSNQRFFTRMAPGGETQRTPFIQQQAAVRGAFGSGANPQPQTGNSGWRRFGEPTQSGGNVQPRGFQSSGNPAGSPGGNLSGNAGGNPGGGSPGGRAGAGWDRFGSPQSAAPQRPAAPPQGQYNRPAYNYGAGPRGNSGNSSNGGQSRALQVAPPMVQQRQAPSGGGSRPAPAPNYRSAPQGNRGGEGGGHSNNNNNGGHGGRR